MGNISIIRQQEYVKQINRSSFVISKAILLVCLFLTTGSTFTSPYSKATLKPDSEFINMSLNKTASQSSMNTEVSKALDSNIDGVFGGGSVVITNDIESLPSDPDDREREAAMALAKRLDLTRPGMEAMRAAVETNNHRAVLDLFRERLVKRLRAIDFTNAPTGPAFNPLRNAHAEMLMGRMTPDDYKQKYGKEWRDEFSRIGIEHYPVLKSSGLMAPLGTPIQWLHEGSGEEPPTEISPQERVGWYLGTWGGGGWGFNTSLVSAWWFSGKDEYRDKWLEISEGYFYEFFTAQTRGALKTSLGKESGAFFPLHTAWRMHRSFLPSLALIAKHLDHSTKPPRFPEWLTGLPSSTIQQERVAAQAALSGDVSAELLKTIPAVPLVWIAIGLTEETAPYLIESYITGDYFFANQNYDGIMAVATIALIFEDLKKSKELEAMVDKAFPWWAGRVIHRDGGALEQCFGYSIGYASEFVHQVELFERYGSQGNWMDEFRRLAPICANFWDQIQTPQGFLPCVGNSKYGDEAPRKSHPQKSTYFPFSGYAGLRTPGVPEDQLFMMFANSRRSVGHMSPNTGSIHVTAYGRDLIVPGGSPSYGLTPAEHKAEEKAFDNYAGEHSSYKNSTVIVNELSQATYNRGRYGDMLASAPDVPVPARWISSSSFDFIESQWVGYDRRQNNTFYAPVEEYISDIAHQRQVVFVKPAGLWLVVDLMRYSPEIKGPDAMQAQLPAKLSPSPYTFTQIWNFAPPRNEERHHYGFSDEQVKIDETGRQVYTDDPSGANLELLHFSGKPLEYKKYFGHKDKKQYLGWIVDGKGVPGTPRVDLHTNWQQNREDLVAGRVMPLVTVIAPSRDAQSVIATSKPRVEQDGLVSGCELTLQDGKTITFLASEAPAQLKAGELVAHAEMLILVGSPGEEIQRGIILGCTGLHIGNRYDAWRPVETPDFEFTFDGEALTVLRAITIPSGQPVVLTSEVADMKKNAIASVEEHAQDVPEAVVSVSVLIEELASNDIGRIHAATESLVKAGTAVVPALAKGLTATTDLFVRLKIVEIFARLRGEGSAALPILSNLVIQEQGAVRERAARAINWIVSDRKDGAAALAIPGLDRILTALVSDLGQADPKVKDSAARAVAYLAPFLDAAAKHSLISTLVPLTGDPTTVRYPGAHHFEPGIMRYPVREAAAWALEQFGLNDQRASACLERYHGQRLFARLNLAIPELAEVATAVKADDYGKALQLYKPIFLRRIGAAAFEEPWNWGHIGPADQLLRNEHRAVQYALKTGATRYVGAPGAMDWFIDEPQNNCWPELTHRMTWTGYLLKAEVGGFAKEGNPAYLEHWMEAFSDFDSNLRHQQAIAQEQYREIGIGNVWWCHNCGVFGWLLHQSFRAEARMNGLAYAVRTFPERTQEAVCKVLLAKFLVAAAEDIDYMAPWLTNVNVIAETNCPSNQLQHAVTAVIKGCVAFSDFTSEPFWADAITTYVTKLLPYYPDGTELEQAFWYNGGVISFAQKFLEMYPQNENAERLRRLALYSQRFLACISLPHTGNTPGEAKTHKKVALSPYFSDPLAEMIVNRVAANEQKVTPGLQPPGSTATLPATRADASGDIPVPAFASVAFPYSGYYILRSGWDHDALHAYFKGGRKGTGHSAATSNQIQLTAYGRTMLTRAGSGLYGAGPWPTYSPYVNSSFSHNTIIVDGKSQNDPNMPQQPDPIPSRWLASESFDFAEAKYDAGYEDLDADITHERQMVFFRQAGLFVVRDRLEAQKEHEYSQVWCFAKDYGENQILADEEDQRVVTSDGSGPNIALYHSGPSVSYTKFYGQKEPYSRGWRNSENPAVDVHASWKGTGAQQLLTVLYPRPAQEFDIEQIDRMNSDGVTGISILRKDGSKIEGRSALDGEQPLEIGGLRILGEALFLYTAADGKVSGLALGASEASIDGKAQNLEASDFAFEFTDGKLAMTEEIRVPTEFEWKETPAGIVPDYGVNP